MPLYEYRKNTENMIAVPAETRDSVVTGSAEVFDVIAARMAERRSRKGGVTAAFDGWYGVDWKRVTEGAASAFRAAGLEVTFRPSASLMKSAAEIDAYRKPFETDDPSFGWVNSDGTMSELFDVKRLEDLRGQLSGKGAALVVYGPGAALPSLDELYDLRFYFDFTMQPMLWQMWGGELVSFGRSDPDPAYSWKKYYYCDFYLLYRQKKHALPRMDFYVDAVHADNLKLVPRGAYETILKTLVQHPIKQVKIMQPGPWGGERYRALWEVPGLECNAWNELAGIELSILIDVGARDTLNIPAQNIMQYPREIVGEYIHRTYPDLMPLQVWLDDGYFPRPVPFERSSMPVHDHPDTEYVRRHFNEPLGRYETYYIVEAYAGATTWMGFKEDADLEEWERRTRESDNQKPIPNWQDFIRRWDTVVGDLFLIPPGTSHGHGGNQMILEMDTGPSVAGTEYSFFTFDFARQTWDDEKKSMTGKRMKMHLDHSFANNRWRREEYVRRHLRARPVVQSGDGETRKDQYTTLPEMPFHIERLFFTKRHENDTEGRFMHIATLAEGEEVTVRSIAHPERAAKIERLQAAIIPAGMGRHEYINEKGGHAMIVLIRMKDG
ncbi:MAG TPA: hypothetical protein VMV03_10645 [Spirochaetia bacterium]|nr:hypothetical protein [Spirochaetia bacterium]